MPAKRIADDLQERIDSGDLCEGDRVPSESQLLAQYGTTKVTVNAAIRLLEARGLVVAEHGRGVFVRPNVYRRVHALVDELSPGEAAHLMEVLIAGQLRRL